jgi:hypothetical protein
VKKIAENEGLDHGLKEKSRAFTERERGSELYAKA